MLAALGLPAEFSPTALRLTVIFRAAFSQGSIVWTMKARGNSEVLPLPRGQMTLRGWLDLDADVSGDAARLHLRASMSPGKGPSCTMPGYRAQAAELGSSVELDYAYGENFHSRGLLDCPRRRILRPTPARVWKLRVSACICPGNGLATVRAQRRSFSIARLQSSGMRGQDISGILVQQGAALPFPAWRTPASRGIAVSFRGNYAPQPSGGGPAGRFPGPAGRASGQDHAAGASSPAAGDGGRRPLPGPGQDMDGEGRAGGSAGLEVDDGALERAGRDRPARAQRQYRAGQPVRPSHRPGPAPALREVRWQEILRRRMVCLPKAAALLSNRGASSGAAARSPWIPCGWTRGEGFQATFRCEGVDLAEMLNALAGSEIVSGDARLSGVIPVKMAGGSPVFLDGYLDTAPGSGGRLQVSKPEAISGGQVLVEEAIRDFHYNWIKVRLSSRNDRLNMVVSIDGAPARKLPLRYDQKKKDFVRDPVRAAPCRAQGAAAGHPLQRRRPEGLARNRRPGDRRASGNIRGNKEGANGKKDLLRAAAALVLLTVPA